MTQKEKIKNFLKPTRAKIVLTVLIFIGTIYFVNKFSISSKFILYFLFPEVFFNFFYDYLEIGLDIPSEMDLWLYLVPLSILVRIAYYYLLLCGVFFVYKKIKRRKNEISS